MVFTPNLLKHEEGKGNNGNGQEALVALDAFLVPNLFGL